jgi:hypothetical protein
MRPQPPASLFDPEDYTGSFVPARELEDWARTTFIDEDATLLNEEHKHLRFASIGFLWTSVGNARHGRRIVGQCEAGTPRAMGRWAQARAKRQIVDWFGAIPNFIITLDAHYAVQCADAEFLALVEHELLHAGHALDVFGQPKSTKNGSPALAIRGHDVEEFVSIVRRYGVGAAAGETFALVEAAKNAPEVAAVNIAQACGTCLKQTA